MTLIAYRETPTATFKLFAEFADAAAWALEGQAKPDFIVDGDQVVPAPGVTPDDVRAVYHSVDEALESIAVMAPTAPLAAATELRALAAALEEYGEPDTAAA
ncbi:hypothetical protein [Elstera cyanobacteriorum]|uniref:hypothetical protein n=1 Tax=Elstera cyanobacteriorum TaxID=2022747 RepID=UPI0023F05D72|nr:hypothetical protein [Elstera cyanobacteriorum]